MSIKRIIIENVFEDKDYLMGLVENKFEKIIGAKYYDQIGNPIPEGYLEELKENAGIRMNNGKLNFMFANNILETDPTGRKYIPFIINVYISNIIEDWRDYDRTDHYIWIQFKEDAPKVREYLSLFHQYKDRKEVKKKDINQYDSVNELYQVVKQFKYEESDYTLEDMKEALNENEYEIWEDGSSDWHVVIPKSEKAACVFGVNTEWCTAWGEESLNKDYQARSNHYRDGDDYYIFINKDDHTERYQLEFTTRQYMDVNDKDISDRFDEIFGDDPLFIEVVEQNIEFMNLSQLVTFEGYLEEDITLEFLEQLYDFRNTGNPKEELHRIAEKIYEISNTSKYFKELIKIFVYRFNKLEGTKEIKIEGNGLRLYHKKMMHMVYFFDNHKLFLNYVDKSKLDKEVRNIVGEVTLPYEVRHDIYIKYLENEMLFMPFDEFKEKEGFVDFDTNLIGRYLTFGVDHGVGVNFLTKENFLSKDNPFIDRDKIYEKINESYRKEYL